MKKWNTLKRLAAAGIAAALLAGTCAAAVITGIDQRLIDFLGGGERAQGLLSAGAQPVDVTAEDNGASLHVTQVLMDRYSILILADFTAPEGTVLDMDEEQEGIHRTFSGLDRAVPSLLDESGDVIDLNQSWSYQMDVLDDGDPLDNHLTLLCRMDLSDGIQQDWAIKEILLPAEDLMRFDLDTEEMITVYSGDWTCRFPVTWQDMGRSIPLNQAAGQVDGVNIIVTDLYLSPMSLQIRLERETPVPLHSDEAVPGAYTHWISALNVERVTLTDKDGQSIPLMDLGGTASNQEQNCSFQLGKITDLAQLQTLTLYIGEERIDIPLDALSAAK